MIGEYGQQNWTLLYSMAGRLDQFLCEFGNVERLLRFFLPEKGWKLHGSLPGDIFEEADAVTVSFSCVEGKRTMIQPSMGSNWENNIIVFASSKVPKFLMM